jgi:hypothetical protein
MHPRRTLLVFSLVLWPGLAAALPVAPAAFCEHYPGSPPCRSSVPDCSFCHTTPPARNAYGAALSGALLPGQPRPLDPDLFRGGLAAALDAVQDQDADGDGASNRDEIAGGTLPGNPDSVPARGRCPDAGEQLGWSPGAPDFPYTMRRLMISVCGRSPTRAEFQALAGAPDPGAHLDTALDRCLGSEHWLGKDGALWSLANRKIKPQQSVKGGDEAGDVPFADYFDDYNLFVYTQIGNHDARELLTATYHVAREDAPTTYAPYSRSPEDDIQQRGFLLAQKAQPERRAGMLTTAWFVLSNTMFTGVPRTTAAQAYRAYLGLDIAKLEGLHPVDREPVDYDSKGVAAPACATCHSTLDPLTYPFAFYAGLGGEDTFQTPGAYVSDRPAHFSATNGPLVASLPETGAIFGQQVRDLVEWGRVAAGSEAFARATVLDYWRLLIGDSPTPAQQAEFDQLWRDFMTVHQYGVERMLHALIKTEAYRVP